MAQCVSGELQCLMGLQRPHIYGAGCSQEWSRLPFNKATNREEQAEGECYDSKTRVED